MAAEFLQTLKHSVKLDIINCQISKRCSMAYKQDLWRPQKHYQISFALYQYLN